MLLFFFVFPLLATGVVSLWNYTEYSLVPDVTQRNYVEMFEGCSDLSNGLCTTFRTYISTLKLCGMVWAITLLLGFTVAYFLCFHVRSDGVRMGLFLLCTAPFLTSNVIRMISWIPLLGREGAVNQFLVAARVVDAPQDWLLFSALLGRAGLRPPLHAVRGGAGLQQHDADRPPAAGSGARRRRQRAGRRCGTWWCR